MPLFLTPSGATVQLSDAENIALMFPRNDESFKSVSCLRTMMELFPDSLNADFEKSLAEGIPLSYLIPVMGSNPFDMCKVFASLAGTLLLALNIVTEERRKTLFRRHTKVYLHRRARTGDLLKYVSVASLFELGPKPRLPYFLPVWFRGSVSEDTWAFLPGYAQQIKKHCKQADSLPAWFHVDWMKLVSEFAIYLSAANIMGEREQNSSQGWYYTCTGIRQLQELVSLYYTEEERANILSQGHVDIADFTCPPVSLAQ